MKNMLPLKIKTGIKSLTNNKCNKTTKLEKTHILYIDFSTYYKIYIIFNVFTKCHNFEQFYNSELFIKINKKFINKNKEMNRIFLNLELKTNIIKKRIP